MKKNTNLNRPCQDRDCTDPLRYVQPKEILFYSLLSCDGHDSVCVREEISEALEIH